MWHFTIQVHIPDEVGMASGDEVVFQLVSDAEAEDGDEMAVKPAVMKANSAGVLKAQLPMNIIGPNGEGITPGDRVRFRILTVEKQDEIR